MQPFCCWRCGCNGNLLQITNCKFPLHPLLQKPLQKSEGSPFAQQLQQLLPHTTKQNHEQPTGTRLRLTVSGPAPHTTVASVLSSRVEPITSAAFPFYTLPLLPTTATPTLVCCPSTEGWPTTVPPQSQTPPLFATRTAYLDMHLTCTAVTPARRNLGASFVPTQKVLALGCRAVVSASPLAPSRRTKSKSSSTACSLPQPCDPAGLRGHAPAPAQCRASAVHAAAPGGRPAAECHPFLGSVAV